MHELLSKLSTAVAWSLALIVAPAGAASGQFAATTQISEDFTVDPRWEGRNQVPPSSAGVIKTQDFGYSQKKGVTDAGSGI